MSSDVAAQTAVLPPPQYYQPLANHNQLPMVENVANLSFTPSMAILQPSNLPSNICTICSGIGNLNINGGSLASSAPAHSGSELNAMLPNYNMHYQQQAIDHVTYSQYHNGSIFSVPKSWPRDKKDDLVVTVYGLVKSLLGASGTNQGAIDNRIEQAMDLVKSHLMTAVRSEVEELKEQILRLEDTISNLQNENEVLKANVSSDVLHQIISPPTSQQQNAPQIYPGSGTLVGTATSDISSSTSVAAPPSTTNISAPLVGVQIDNISMVNNQSSLNQQAPNMAASYIVHQTPNANVGSPSTSHSVGSTQPQQ